MTLGDQPPGGQPPAPLPALSGLEWLPGPLAGSADSRLPLTALPSPCTGHALRCC